MSVTWIALILSRVITFSMSLKLGLKTYIIFGKYILTKIFKAFEWIV